MTSLSPIILFVYNRPEHTQKTLQALADNSFSEKSKLYLFSDGPKNDSDIKKISKVRDIVNKLSGRFFERELTFRDSNLGLANSIITGVNQVFEYHDTAIVLEDDIVTSNLFLKFMNDALRTFEFREDIKSISGYTFPINIPKHYTKQCFIAPRVSSWGWATWKKYWTKVDWELVDYEKFIKNKEQKKKFNFGGEDLTNMLISQQKGKIDSWAIRWTYFHFKTKSYCLYPTKSLVKNIGIDNSGTHIHHPTKFNVNLHSEDRKIVLDKNIDIDDELLENFRKVFKKNLFQKIYAFLKYMF